MTDNLKIAAPAAAPTPALSGYVHATESGSAVDGPGIRYVLFVSGCPLQCQYCHNPDSQCMKQGTYQTVAEATATLKAYAPMLKRMKGGFTISGGEPLTQPAFTHAILKEAKASGLHTALDTSGFLGTKATDALLADVDLVLLDIKSMLPDLYKTVTGVDLAPTLAFAERLAAMHKPVWIRFVLVPGLTDVPENVTALGTFVANLPNVERLEVLPFHQLGKHKWEDARRPYLLADTPSPTPEQTESVRQALRACGVKTVV